MKEFHEEMEQIHESIQSKVVAQEATVEHKKEATHELERELKQVLAGIARDFIKGDGELRVELPSAGGIGFAIIYKGALDSQQFAVSATCKQNDVTLNVADGNWQEIQGTLGNWAHWADQKQVYNGRLDEHRIRRSLEKQFLPWYKGVVGRPPQ